MKVRREMQARFAAEEAQRAEHVRAAKARTKPRATHRSNGDTAYGRNVAGPDNQSILQRSGAAGSVFQANQNTASLMAPRQRLLGTGSEVARTPTAPPEHVALRIASFSRRPLQDVSEPGIPVDALNKAFPGAKSRAVVEHEGARYLRKFIPKEKEGQKVKIWNVKWERLDETQQA